MSLALAAQVIGFISFAITLATLLGVYSDLISTVRHADTNIPLMLGNLRQEIEAEKVLLRYRLREGDQYAAFPKAWRKRRRRQGEVTKLLEVTLNNLWQDFKNVERPFLIRNPVRAESVQRGDYWGDSDIEEKPYAKADEGLEKKVKDRMGLAEAGLFSPGQRYYRTDLVHRFIWWQSKSRVLSMLDQVQRIQIRRIERDAFESDELIKRCLDILERRPGGRSSRSGSRTGGSGSDGGNSGVLKPSHRDRSRSRPVSVRAPSRRMRRGTQGDRTRDIEERETVMVHREDLVRPRDGEASNTSRRRERSPQPRYVYEVVHPGRTYVEDHDGRSNPQGDVEYLVSERATVPRRTYD